MNTAQLTPRALDVIADSGETGELPLRNAAPGRETERERELREALSELYDASEGRSDKEIRARLKARRVIASAIGSSL